MSRDQHIDQSATSIQSLLNPIPTSQGRNQPLYERHVTKPGRNRVKVTFCEGYGEGYFRGRALLLLLLLLLLFVCFLRRHEFDLTATPSVVEWACFLAI